MQNSDSTVWRYAEPSYRALNTRDELANIRMVDSTARALPLSSLDEQAIERGTADYHHRRNPPSRRRSLAGARFPASAVPGARATPL
jgi:hypothetical protein